MRNLDVDIYDTPAHYNHKFGDFEPFKLKGKHVNFAFVKIPKNMSTKIKEAIQKHPDFIEMPDNNPRYDLSDFKFFTVVRPEYERLFSGIDTWLINDDTVNTKTEKMQKTLVDIITNTNCWDEHVEPQISFLLPFLEHNVKVKVIDLDKDLNKNLSTFLGIDLDLPEWDDRMPKKSIERSYLL
jgi:hypothetical protein